MKSRESLIRLKKFQVDDKRRQVNQIEVMIGEYVRMVGDLDEQIVTEQARVGIHDVAHYAYPTFARAAMQRRDNLKVSIRELEGNLERARDELAIVVEDLKKIELLEERDHGRERDAREMAEQLEMDEIGLRRRSR